MVTTYPTIYRERLWRSITLPFHEGYLKKGTQMQKMQTKVSVQNSKATN